MIYTEDWVRQRFDKYNKEYFGGKIRPFNRVKLTLNSRMYATGGKAMCFIDYKTYTTSNYELILSTYYDFNEDVKESILIHEMIHMYDYETRAREYCERGYDAHGDWFLRQCKRLNEATGYKLQPYMDNSIDCYATKAKYGVVGLLFSADDCKGFLKLDKKDYETFKQRYANSEEREGQPLRSKGDLTLTQGKYSWDKITFMKTSNWNLPYFACSCKKTKPDFDSGISMWYNMSDDIQDILNKKFSIDKTFVANNAPVEERNKRKVKRFADFMIDDAAKEFEGGNELKISDTILEPEQKIEKCSDGKIKVTCY